MSGFDARNSRKSARKQTGAAIAALVLCVLLIAWMAWAVLRQIEELSAANSDNLQWSLSQADVEFLRFRLSLQRAQDGSGTLNDARRRFDIFYSRMSTIENGEVFRTLRENPEFAGPRAEVRGFLDSTVPLIDGPDQDLRAALPNLTTDAEGIGEEVRKLSLSALGAFAMITDSRRIGLLQMLGLFGSVLVVFFVVLGVLAYALFRLFRLADRRARQLETAGARMATVVETSPNAIIVTDEIGTIREFNSAAEKLFGYSRAEARGRSAIELLVPDARLDDDAWKLVNVLSEDRRPDLENRTFELILKDRLGNPVEAEVSIDRADADTPIYVCYIRDIARRKLVEETLTRARDQALAAERAKSKFLAVMSHEMRTPLNGLLGSMQLLEEVIETDRQKELLDRMQMSGNQLLTLVNDVLDLAKYEAGKLELDRTAFYISDMLDDVVATAAPLARSFGNRIGWRWEGEKGDSVLGDCRKIQQVLLNFVSNAAKFTRDGSIEIEVEYIGSDRTMVEFRVFDTGIGIAEEDLGRIFKDFETLDSSYAREAGGTGLGLGIAQRFAKLMNGEVGAESEPGEGSLFWLRVPLREIAEHAGRPSGQETAALQPDSPLDVLLVEDNDINRRIAREMLEGAGHAVFEAADGKSGVDQAEARTFDVILMDISMPVMDGTAATQAIRQGQGESRTTPIIALTAHALEEERKRFFDIGMDACLSKPVDRALLLRTMAEVTRDSDAGQRYSETAPQVQEAKREAEAEEGDFINVGFLRTLISDLPEDAAVELLKRFIEDTDNDMRLIAASAPDGPELQATIHRSAGGCGTFGLDKLRTALAEAETALKTGTPLTRDDLNRLVALWADSRKALIALLTGQGNASAAAPSTVTTLPISARFVTELS